MVVFSLSALWWRRIRGLWKLTDWVDWLKGILGLVLDSGPVLSKSLIQFSVDGWSCAPSLLFTWGQTIVDIMKIMVKVKVKSFSGVRLFATPWTAASQAPPSMGFSRQEYWSGLPLLSPIQSYYILNFDQSLQILNLPRPDLILPSSGLQTL